MTQEIFLQLLKDASKGKDVFDRFLQKNRNIFEQMIGIKFSGKKYVGIDVEGIYFNGFMDFAIDQLEHSKINLPFNEWISKLAVDRVVNIRSTVNKCLAKSLLEKGGRGNWDDAYELICKEYPTLINRVISRYFDTAKYNGYIEDVRNIFMTLFYLERVKSPNPIKEIENMESYLYRMLANHAIKKEIRLAIDQELGLDHYDSDIKEFDKTEGDEFELNNNDSLLTDDSDRMAEEFASMAEDFLSEQGSNEEKVWAEKEIEKLLTLMGKSKDADLIRKVMLWGYDYKELAREEQCSDKNIYLKVSRAMYALNSVALPYIKLRCRGIFYQNAVDLNNEYERKILDEFFSTNKSLDKIALSFNKDKDKFTKELINAFRKVKKIHKEKKIGYVSDDDVVDYLNSEMRQDAKKTILKIKTQQTIA